MVVLPDWLAAGYGHYFTFPKSPPYKAFRRRLILRIAAASPSRFSACDRPQACVMSFLTPRGGSTCTWLVNGDRAPLYGAASRLTIASSNARVPPMIRSYPQTLLRYIPHPPKVGMYPLVSCLERTYRTARAGDIGACIAQKLFI
jgi:hypothetical protein